MDIEIKTFSQLTSGELYGILRVRQEIFILEQTCVYLDADGTDLLSTHFFIKEGEEDGNNIAAYCRLYWHPEQDNCVLLGRVLTRIHGKGMGLPLVNTAVNFAKKHYRPEEILIHAQEYAIPFYEKAGFVVSSDPFLEDNIPHKMMKILL